MSLHIKKDLLKKIPPVSKSINYIVKIETQTETDSTSYRLQTEKPQAMK